MRVQLGIVILLLIAVPAVSQNSDELVIENLIQSSGVKNQHNSNACWSFSTTSFIEAEIKRIYNRDIELSPMFFIYYNYINQSVNYLNKKGDTRFSPGGLPFQALDVYDEYGCVPSSVVESKLSAENYDYQRVCCPIKSMLDTALLNGASRDDVLRKVTRVLDKHAAPVPDSFKFKGDTFTPKEFSGRIGKIYSSDYCAFTSYRDLGFYQECILPVAANWTKETYYNVPLKEFLGIVNYALENGYTLLWDGDVTEDPIITDQGVDFKVKKVDLFQFPKDTAITDDLRQKTFNDKSTTEDHNSLLVGIAYDKMDNAYYILKDSNGEDSFLNGFIYISETYLALKTVSLVVHKDGVPAAIKERIVIDNG